MWSALFWSALPAAQIGFAFRESNLPGKLIVLILFVGSIFAWTIMLSKYFELRRAKRSAAEFLVAFRKERHPAALFLRHRRFPECPIWHIYQQGCQALGAELDTAGSGDDGVFMDRDGGASRPLSPSQIEAVRHAVDRQLADQALLIEDNMGFLATAVSASPFLGLLGTVWGVMDSFGGMAVTGTATLGSVAPGISGALVTTVVGLLVALPSAVGYNLLANQIRRLCVQMDNFAQEFNGLVQRTFSKD